MCPPRLLTRLSSWDCPVFQKGFGKTEKPLKTPALRAQNPFKKSTQQNIFKKSGEVGGDTGCDQFIGCTCSNAIAEPLFLDHNKVEYPRVERIPSRCTGRCWAGDY